MKVYLNRRERCQMREFYVVYETCDPYEPPAVVGFYRSRVRAIVAAFIHAKGEVWRLTTNDSFPPDIYVGKESFND